MQKTERKIRNVGKLYIQRSEQFHLKRVVSDFIERLIELSAKHAKDHISLMKYATFCYGELQMHSIVAPALAKLADCFIMEYPIRRGESDNSGRSIIIVSMKWVQLKSTTYSWNLNVGGKEFLITIFVRRISSYGMKLIVN